MQNTGMQFNMGDGLSMVDEINDTCGTDQTDFPLTAIARRVNAALDMFYSIALAFDKSFTFDDSNKYEADGSTLRKLPFGRTQINAGQQDYPFALELLKVKSVFVKDANGLNHELTEETTPKNTLLQNSPTQGTPTKYRLMGNSILLDPIPDYTQALSLMVEFSRNGSKFKSDDSNKQPGIPSIFHIWLCQMASLPYLIQNDLPRKNDIAVLVAQGKEDIKDFMANRNQTKVSRMAPARHSNK